MEVKEEESRIEFKEEGEDNNMEEEHTAEVGVWQEVKTDLRIKREDLVFGVKKEEVTGALLKIEGKGFAEETFTEESKVLKMEEKNLLDASTSSSLLLSNSFDLQDELGGELGAEVELGLDGGQVEPANLFRPFL